jgi:UDP-2,3-diacylglucosamine pyrophosphatase LpxH
MSLFCISDLHLGDKGPRDNFYARGEDRFLRFLDYVDHEKGELVILGDLIDEWQCNFSAVVMAYTTLLQALCDVGMRRPRWVLGNHDGMFSQFLGTDIRLINSPLPAMSAPFTLTLGDKAFAFAHGHEFDPTCNSLNPGLGELTAIISGILEDRNKGPKNGKTTIEDKFIGSLELPLNIWRQITRQASRNKEMLGNAAVYRQGQKADVLVYGHTHAAGRVGNAIYNTGCWCRDVDTFVRIDDGEASMWIWDNDHAEFFNETLQ